MDGELGNINKADALWTDAAPGGSRRSRVGNTLMNLRWRSAPTCPRRLSRDQMKIEDDFKSDDGWPDESVTANASRQGR
jgi:hypothetical protein